MFNVLVLTPIGTSFSLLSLSSQTQTAFIRNWGYKWKKTAENGGPTFVDEDEDDDEDWDSALESLQLALEDGNEDAFQSLQDFVVAEECHGRNEESAHIDTKKYVVRYSSLVSGSNNSFVQVAKSARKSQRCRISFRWHPGTSNGCLFHQR